MWTGKTVVAKGMFLGSLAALVIGLGLAACGGGGGGTAAVVVPPGGGAPPVVVPPGPPLGASCTATSGQLTLSAGAARAGGVSPLAVFFDATATTHANPAVRPFHDIEYRWDFGDPGSGNWAVGSRPGVGNSRNTATGPVATHLYEPTPGGGDQTFTITVTAFDGTNTATCQVQVTANDPETVFAGANTICFSTTGNFAGVPAGTCTTPGVTAITTSDFDAALATHHNTNKRLLFRRGETFVASVAATLERTGPGIVGAFPLAPSPVKPRITGANVALINLSNGTPTFSDWRVMDLELDGASSGLNSFGVQGSGGADQITLLRLNLHHTHVGLLFSYFGLDGLNGGGAGPHHIWDQLAVYDSTIANIGVGLGGNGGFISSTRFSYVGNTVTDTTGGEHILRTPWVSRGVIANNDMSLPGTGRHIIKLHAPCRGGAGCPTVPETAVQGTNPTQFVIIADNVFLGGPGVDQPVTVGPQDNLRNELVENTIIERNWFRSQGSTQVLLTLSAAETTARNNLFDLSGAAFHTGILIERRGVEVAPNQNRIYNNTFFSGSAGDFFGVRIDGTSTNTTVRNNLGSAQLAAGPSILLGTGASGLVQSNNLLNNSPAALFANAAPTVPNDFRLLAGVNPAVDAGILVPVFSDFSTTTRPNSAGFDIGAFER